MIEAEDSDWSLPSVEVEPQQKMMEQDESSFNHTTLHEQYSYQTKNPPTSKPVINATSTLHIVGKVISIVQDFVVIEADNNKVMNLESYVLNKNKEIVGYIVDVLGPVGHHFYALKQQGEHVSVGESLFFTEGCRILKDQDIDKLKQVGAIKDIDSDDQKQEQIQSKAFKRNREESVDFKNSTVKFPQPKFNPNISFLGAHHNNNQQQNIYNQGLYQQPQTFNQNMMFGYQNPQNQMNYPPQQPQMNMTAINQLYNPTPMAPPMIPPTSPQQMLIMSQYYQNCYNQMMSNQKK